MEDNMTNQVFPFGEPLKVLTQQDRSLKKVFVLGVYASAVHAKWFSPEGKLLCQALAVASEPGIFWTGDKDEAERLIAGISIPKEAGYLQAADEQYNGSSGRALDTQILKPLGYTRNDAWLCDLVPYSCRNDNQSEAITAEYNPICEKFDLPASDIPPVSAVLTDGNRRNEILQELVESQATTIILLGDDPIKWFLSHVSDCKKTKLADFGEDSYGTETTTAIAGKSYRIIPLTHPHQIEAMGNHSPKWYALHQQWIQKQTVKH
jgi:hypothetical protein